MAARSKQLAATSFGDTSQHSIYTVPSGFRTIVKSIAIQSAASTVQHVTFTIKSGSTSLSIFSVDLQANGTSGACQFVQPWIVLEAGQTLAVTFGVSGGWLTVSGAELEL